MALNISSPLPTVGGDSGTWGTELNTAITEIINEAGKDSDIVSLQSTKADKTNPVLDGTATGTATTTTGEANKLVKINSSGNLYLSNNNLDLINSYIRIKDTQTTPQQWWIGSGVAPNDGKFFIFNLNTSTQALMFNPVNSQMTISSLAGTGNRAVYSDANGGLTNTSSDERVKKNVKNITETMNVLEVLKNIRGITYNWDNTIKGYENAGEQEEIGVIAQEIEPYIPQIVGENQTGYKSVDYAKLVAFLIETNKALLERIEVLESKVV